MMTGRFVPPRLMGCLLACGWIGLLIGAGCGKSVSNGTVSGKVMLEGKPVPEGCTVSFVSDKFTAAGKVGVGGSYTLLDAGKPNIPTATYKVSVAPPAQQMSDAEYDKLMSPGGTGAAAPPPAVIPAKFQNPATSGLSYPVQQGPNTIDIDLK